MMRRRRAGLVVSLMSEPYKERASLVKSDFILYICTEINPYMSDVTGRAIIKKWHVMWHVVTKTPVDNFSHQSRTFPR